MSKGIYCYINKKTGIVDYIGKFSERKRIKAHYQPSRYDDQPFNRVLQNNPERYEVKIICEYPDLTDDELNYLEIKEILKHKFLYGEIPRFNFTIGGDGATGYKHSGESRKKISESLTGKKRPPFSDEWKKNMGKSHKKNYARIIKKGFNGNKQRYAIVYESEQIKTSHYIHKLYKWFGKNYPNQYLYLEV